MDNQETGPQPSWWVVCLKRSGLLFGLLAIAFCLPHPYGVAFASISLLAFGFQLLINPKYWYRRSFAALTVGWMLVRRVGNIELDWLSEGSLLHAALTNDAPWSFDIAIGAIALALLYFDHLARFGSISSPILGLSISNSFNSFFSSNRFFSHNYANVVDKHAQIDKAVAFLRDQKPELAIQTLTELQQHHELTPREKFRLETNLGNAHCQKDEWKKGARHFLKAKDAQPEDEQALGNEAIAHLLLGNTDVALVLANKVLERDPTNEAALGAMIQAESPDVSVEDLAEYVPEDVRDSDQVLFALFMRAGRYRDLVAAEKYSRKLLTLKTDDGQAQLALGSALSGRAIDGFLGHEEITVSDCESMATEALQLLCRVLDRESIGRVTQSQARYHRALCYEVLGKTEQAESDLRAAIEADPNDHTLNFQLCVFLVRHDKYALAIEHFEEFNCQESRFNPGVLFARLLIGQKDEASRERAKTILNQILDSPEENRRSRFEALHLLCRTMAADGEAVEAEQLSKTHSKDFGTLECGAISAVIKLVSNDIEAAKSACKKAFESATDDSLLVAKYFLAKSSADAGEHETAVEIAKSMGSTVNPEDATGFVLESAWQAKDFEFLLTYCGRLRELGRETDLSLELEIATLETLNEHQDAIALLDQVIAESDDDLLVRYFRAKRNVICMQIEEPDRAEFDPVLLPNINDLDAENPLSINVVAMTAKILSDGPNPADGYELAYELVRRRFDSLLAHQCLLSVCGPGQKTGYPTPDVVEVGCAVQYRDDAGKEKWAVVEGNGEASPSRDEITPDSHLAEQLLGKSVGDKFKSNTNTLQDRWGEITGILHKIDFRAMDSLMHAEERFPDSNFVMRFNFSKPDGTIDIDAFVEVSEKLNETLERRNAHVSS